MFPTEPASPIAISSLPSQAFATLSGMNNIIWHHIQVPIDHTLLVYEDNSMVYVLDFDDASGEMNMMSYNDIQILIQDLDITS